MQIKQVLLGNKRSSVDLEGDASGEDSGGVDILKAMLVVKIMVVLMLMLVNMMITLLNAKNYDYIVDDHNGLLCFDDNADDG